MWLVRNCLQYFIKTDTSLSVQPTKVVNTNNGCEGMTVVKSVAQNENCEGMTVVKSVAQNENKKTIENVTNPC